MKLAQGIDVFVVGHLKRTVPGISIRKAFLTNVVEQVREKNIGSERVWLRPTANVAGNAARQKYPGHWCHSAVAGEVNYRAACQIGMLLHNGRGKIRPIQHGRIYARSIRSKIQPLRATMAFKNEVARNFGALGDHLEQISRGTDPMDEHHAVQEFEQLAYCDDSVTIRQRNNADGESGGGG